jgi:hypothetical protein
MRRARVAAYFVAIASTLLAQETAVLRNDGQPLRVPFACTSENLDWAGLACADDDPCSIYLELNAVTAAGKMIFLAGNLQHGELLIDGGKGAEGGRYKKYESDTGGDSWSIRAATDTAPKMPGAPLVDADYRIVAGKNVYRIEKRAGGKWSSIAMFAVNPATCKSLAQKETTPLPEPAPDNAAPNQPQ